MMTGTAARGRLGPWLLAASGAAALLYEVVWTRWLALAAGNFATATTAVVAVFMGGMAVGNALGSRGAARWTPADAWRRYVRLEAAIAVLGLASPWLWSPESALLRFLSGIAMGPAARGLVSALPLALPAMLMGATLPAAVGAMGGGLGRAGVGRVYAANTVGGAIGVLGAAFWLIPLAGMRGTVGCAAVLNLAAAAAAWFVAAGTPVSGSQAEGVRHPPAATLAVLAMAAFTGFLSLGFELALTRQFILTVTGGSVYGFAAVLASFLAGIALGAAVLRRAPPATREAAWNGCGVALLAIWGCAMTTAFWDRVPVFLLGLWLQPLSFASRWMLDVLVITLLTLVLTVAFGWILPSLVASEEDAGPVFGANTAGAVAGTLVTGFVLLPSAGLHATFLLLGTAAMAGAALAWRAALPAGRRRRILLLAIPAILPPLLRVPDPILMNLGMWNRPILFDPAVPGSFGQMLRPGPDRGTIVYQRDGYTGRIAVWRLDRPGGPSLLSFIVNGKPDGSNGPSDMFTQLGSVHLAALAHPHPRRALVIGLGTGISAGSLVLHPEIEEVLVAENEPAQVDVARLFAADNGHVLDEPKVRVVLDDARRVLAAGGPPFDVIFSEPSNLFVSGMVSLYTKEFYRLTRTRLAPGGVFLQWLHYYQMRPEEVRGAMRTFLSVFPEGTFWINPFGDSFLLARDGGMAVDEADWTRRLSRPALRADLARLRMTNPVEMLGFFLWGPEDLARFAGPGPVCTDDRPFLEYSTPRNRYVRDSTAARVAMQQWGPVAPMPLSSETPALRRKLGRLFAARHSEARAAAELARADVIGRESPRAGGRP